MDLKSTILGELRDLGLSPQAKGTGKRREERNRRAALTSGTAVVARGVQIATSLITIPLTVHYLGNERFGLWMAISSILAMANFADFGIGNGVLNTVAEASGKDDFDRIRAAISSGFAILSLIALLLFVLLASSFGWISWASVFRVTSPQARVEAAPALLIFACCFILNIPLDIVQRTQLGLQQGFRTNFWQICGSLLGLAGVISAVLLHAGLPVLVAALAGAPVVATALNWFHFFLISRPDLLPRYQFVSKDVISSIANFGTLFFVLQLVVAVSFSADSFIVARTLGSATVPDYAIPQRMFSLISVLVAMLVTPLWPAYAEAISRDDIAWVRRTLGRSLRLVLIFASVASVTLLLTAHRIMEWWVGPSVKAPWLLLLGLAVWTVVECCGGTVAMFLNGAGIMRFQIIVASVFGVACLAAKVYFTLRFGIVAVPWATFLTYVPIVGIATAVFVPRALRNLRCLQNPILLASPVVEDQ